MSSFAERSHINKKKKKHITPRILSLGRLWYGTFNFHYQNEQFNRLADLNEFNTLLGEQTVKDVIAGCMPRRRQRRAHLSDRLSDL